MRSNTSFLFFLPICVFCEYTIRNVSKMICKAEQNHFFTNKGWSIENTVIPSKIIEMSREVSPTQYETVFSESFRRNNLSPCFFFSIIFPKAFCSVCCNLHCLSLLWKIPQSDKEKRKHLGVRQVWIPALGLGSCAPCWISLSWMSNVRRKILE